MLLRARNKQKEIIKLVGLKYLNSTKFPKNIKNRLSELLLNDSKIGIIVNIVRVYRIEQKKI
jgi:hypothetical protein